MASRSSPRGRRLLLWRNTIQLFHQYNRPAFVGPFKKLGFEYKIEPVLLNEKGESRKPDIVASAASGWLVMDLTFNDASKELQLVGYKSLEPRYLGQYALQPHERPPDVLSSRLGQVNDVGFCQLCVAGLLEVQKAEHLSNAALRTALVEAQRLDLVHLPSLPFTLLPEMQTLEIREGIADLALQLFAPDSAGMRAVEMVDKGLERLADLISPRDKSVLVDKVNTQMRGLVKILEGYLEEASGIFRASTEAREHPRAREFVTNKLRTWLKEPASLADWWPSDEPAPDDLGDRAV